MIELTEQQLHELDAAPSDPPRVVDPRTRQTFVLVPVEEYQRLTNDDAEYDDSPWTREELEALAWETGRIIGWQDMDDYDNIPDPTPEKP